MSMELANRICPKCKNPNYMVLLGDFSKAYKYKCMNCNRYFNDIDFEKEPLETQKTGEWITQPSNIPNVLWKCSECGTVIYSESEQDRKEFHKYCGKCGAVMN